jgi:hypothetical protein
MIVVRHTQVEIQYRGTARSRRCSAQPRNASTIMVHAITNAVKPMQTVKINMAIKSKYSIYQMMSLACKNGVSKIPYRRGHKANLRWP